MKIVHICDHIYTDGLGYQENKLSYYHKKLGHDVTIISIPLKWSSKGNVSLCDIGEYVNQDGIKVIRRNFKFTFLPFKFLFTLGLYKDLYPILCNEKPDIIFRHTCEGMSLADVGRYKKSHVEVKVFIDNHADYSNISKKWVIKKCLNKFLFRKNVEKIVPFVEKFYGVLPARVDFLHDVYNVPKEKIQLLVMGADDEKVYKVRNDVQRSILRDKYHISNEDFLIVTGGKIDQFKKQTILLMQVVSHLSEKVKLIVFGSVDEQLKPAVDRLTDGIKIQYVSWLDEDEIYKHFYAADLAVFPGRHSVMWEEITGLGVPAIFKYWKGMTHIDLGGNCKFLYHDSVEEIEAVLNEIINDKNLYTNMKKIAREKGMGKFSYKKIAQESIRM